MIKYSLTFVCFFIFSIAIAQEKNDSKKEINSIIDQWHKAAAKADFDGYFGLMDDESIFIGTDPTENWTLPAFKTFSKPYFDKGKAWSFTPLERNIFMKTTNTDIAWFDELLNTQMGICRGSGVLTKTKKGWLIKHYVLSITIPNEQVTEVTKAKASFEKQFIEQLKSK